MKTKIFLLFFILNFFKANAQEQLDIFFDFNKYDINPVAYQKLSDWMEYNKDVEVLKIYGYCDWIGSHQYNDSLSVKRVTSVFKFLIENKIKIKPNYEIKGFGKDFEQSKIQSDNRKVTIVYQKIMAVVPKTEEAILLEELNNKLKTAKVGDIIKLKNINFFNNSARLIPESKPVLYELLCVMNDNPKLKIEIQGHICCQTKADQFDVSTARARAIYVYLTQNKIDRKRLTFKGYGITRPIHTIPEKNPQEEEENRRVEIKIVEN